MGNRVEIEIGGCVNGVPIDVAGMAEIEESGVLIELRAVRAAFHWDYALLAQPLVDLVVATSGAELDDPIASRIRLDIYDEDGREVGDVAISVLVSKDGDGIRLMGEIQRGCCRFELGEAAVGIDVARQGGSLRLGLDSTVLTSGWRYRTNRGHGYESVAMVTICGRANSEVRAAELRAIIERDVHANGAAQIAIEIGASNR